LSTSRFEGLPLSYIEAQACCCPVIGPDIRGVNECVIPTYGGVLYSPDASANSVASLVIETIRDLNGMERRRRLCRKHVEERFTLERMARDYLSIYRKTKLPRHRPVSMMMMQSILSIANGFSEYVQRNWSCAHRQYLASRILADQREWRLASSAVRSSFS